MPQYNATCPSHNTALSGDPSPSNSTMDSDPIFLVKLVGASLGGAWCATLSSTSHQHPPADTGAAVIKYGSLLTDIPFDANAALALLMVAAPPVAYAALLARRSQP